MDGIRQYIVSAAAAGIFCAIVKTLLPGRGMAARLLRLVCGIFLTSVLLSPKKKWDFSSFSNVLSDFAREGELAVQSGEILAQEARADIIKEESQAYILDKARQLGGTLEVEIFLDENSVPVEAVLTGTISPYGKSVLAVCMEEELGITRENQTWIG